VLVNVAGAKNKLPQLIKAVENGASVTICRRGGAVADKLSGERTLGGLVSNSSQLHL